MCKSAAEGGQRCAAHTRTRFTKTEQALESIRAGKSVDTELESKARAKFEKAAVEYASTYEGLTEISRRVEVAVRYGSNNEAAAYENIRQRGQRMREANQAAAELVAQRRTAVIDSLRPEAFRKEYEKTVHDFIKNKGRAVLFSKRWDSDPDDSVNYYGWDNGSADYHVQRKCEWVVPDDAPISEKTYMQFDGTFVDSKEEVGINVDGCNCKCGQYQNITLRYVGTISDAIENVVNWVV